MMLCDLIKQKLKQIRKNRCNVLRDSILCLFLFISLFQFLTINITLVYCQPSDLLVFAETASFARLDDIDPCGWFYQAVLYNPTDSDIAVTGLRWWYNTTSGVDFIDDTRNAKCFDSRYFSNLPTVWISASDDRTKWEYPNGTISITVPAREIVLTWIEVPTNSKNTDTILTTYYVEACVGSQWISSQLYLSHSGHDKIVSTVFRTDFDLTTDPNDERQNLTQHTLKTAEWLFNEDRSIIANSSTRARLIPVTSSRNTAGIDYATINVTLPSGWSYVLGSAYNPYGETITLYSVDGKDRLKWDLATDVYRYSDNQSMAQNYIEFNVTAPYAPGISNFTVTSIVTSLAELLTTIENQSLHVVAKTPPNATFVSSSTTPLTGEDIVFNATNSHDLDGQITDYFWDFGDGNIGTGSIANHAYADNGTYQVTLTVTDNDGLDDTTSDMITVQNRPPIAQFSESATIVDTEVSIYFNASDSYDPDGSIVVYFWDFGDGTNATGLIVTHSYAENGTYVVTLTVTDNDAAKASTNATKTVLNQHPVASFTESAETVYTGETITFNATSSYDSDGFIISYFWDFGDGENTTGVVVDHSYVDNGAYTVTLTVTDEDGDSGIATSVKSIVNRDPVASFIIGPQQPIAGKIVVFNASASYDLDGDIVSYRWDFGDENTTIIASSSITHRYASFGNYTVVLTVIDNDNFYNSSAITIAVHNVDVSIIDVVVPTKNINLGQTVTIVVVVKNEGTTNTTFNVIVSANDTSIETRIIQDLRPSEIRNLNFAWNTSTLTESGTYVVRVETDGIQDETDVADNLNENVRVEMHSHPFNIWGELSSYAMPIGIGLISFLAVVGTILIRRNRQAASPKTLPPKESRVFDELLSDIPDAYSVMVIGDAGSGKSVFCQQLANMYLKQGKSCIYVTYDCFPDEIRENMRTLGWDTSMYEQREAFLFIDCYSSNAGLESKEKHNIQQSFTLSELGIAISATIEDLKQKPVRILLDSTVPLFARLDQAKVVEFLQDRSARIKGENGVFFFVVGKGTLSDDHISRLEEIVDCIVELQVVEENGNIEKRLRIKKLRGRKFAHAWIPFRIASKNGITFLVEKRK